MKIYQQYELCLDMIPILDQGETGRCWLFAGINHLRHLPMAKIAHGTNGFSTLYLSFLDKYEKANCFLTNIIEHRDASLDDRMINYWLNNPCSDLGQWTMFVNLIKKYGLMPYQALPETQDSMISWQISSCINNYLRLFAKTLRNSSSTTKTLDEQKSDMLNIILKILCDYYNCSQIADVVSLSNKMSINGTEYYKTLFGNYCIDDYYCLMHAPNLNYYRCYDLVGTQNITGANSICYLNLPIDTILGYVIQQLEDGLSVWFGADAGKYCDYKRGCFEICNNMNTLNDPILALSKGERLDYGCSIMTHAMNIIGLHKNSNNKPLLWLSENTKGNRFGDNGYIHITDDWMREFGYQFVINKKYISPNILESAEKSPHGTLYPWSPLGALAKCD